MNRPSSSPAPLPAERFCPDGSSDLDTMKVFVAAETCPTRNPRTRHDPSCEAPRTYVTRRPAPRLGAPLRPRCAWAGACVLRDLEVLGTVGRHRGGNARCCGGVLVATAAGQHGHHADRGARVRERLGGYMLLRSAVRLLVLLWSSIDLFVGVSIVTGIPCTLALMTLSFARTLSGRHRDYQGDSQHVANRSSWASRHASATR